MKIRLAWRGARLVLHVLLGVSACALVFPWARERLRERLVRWWSRRLLGICGVRIDLQGGPGAARQAGLPECALIVANHVSWLDIFVINALAPCHFVAKAEIRAWPLVGWMAARAGTIFIARGNRRDLRHIFQGLVDTLAARRRVGLFPEGTTSSQGSLLPFHANLFEAAVDARVSVQPLALAYLRADGSLHPAVDYTGDTTIGDSALRILGSPEPLRARVTCLAAIPAAGRPRREVAKEAQEAVGRALGVMAAAGQH